MVAGWNLAKHTDVGTFHHFSTNYEFLCKFKFCFNINRQQEALISNIFFMSLLIKMQGIQFKKCTFKNRKVNCSVTSEFCPICDMSFIWPNMFFRLNWPNHLISGLFLGATFFLPFLPVKTKLVWSMGLSNPMNCIEQLRCSFKSWWF